MTAHHPFVEAVAETNPTLSTRVARDRARSPMATSVIPTQENGAGTTALREKALAALREERAKSEAKEAQRRANLEARERTAMRERVRAVLEVDVAESSVEIVGWAENEFDEETPEAVVEIDGIRYSALTRWDSLRIVSPCTRCGRQLDAIVGNLAQLGHALEQKLAHPWDCIAPAGKVEADYEIVAPEHEQRARDVEAAAKFLGETKAAEEALEDERPLAKAAAIKRLMDAGAATSVTAAEKIVEQDEEYSKHRARQREAVIATQVAWGKYEAAKARALAAANLAGAR